MATTTTQVSGSIATLLSTGLNSLATGNTALSAAYSSSGGYVFAELELTVTYGTNPTANTGVSIWILRALDGTNYEDGTAGTPGTIPARTPDLVIPVAVSTSAQRITRPVVIRPGTFEVLLRNDAGQTMAASANTLKILPFTFQQA